MLGCTHLNFSISYFSIGQMNVGGEGGCVLPSFLFCSPSLCVASSVTGVSNGPRVTVGSQPLLCPELLCGPLGAAVATGY